MKILLGYDAFWLKLGLETVFRKTISPKQKGTVTHLRDLSSVYRGV